VKAARLTNHPIGSSGTTTGSGIPRIVSGYDDGPVSISQGSLYSIGSMHLGGGARTIVAKAWIDETVGYATVRCRLLAGRAADEVNIILVPSGRSTTSSRSPCS